MMTGMFYSAGWASSPEGYSTSDHHELPPLNVIAEFSLSGIDGTASANFTHVEWLDDSKVQRHDDLSPPGLPESGPCVIARNQMTRIDWSVTVVDATVFYVVNLFFWDAPVT
jgi:hypothetical protein